MPAKPSWISLVPGQLPDRRLTLSCNGIDLVAICDPDDLLPLREVVARDSPRRDLEFATHRYFINASRYAAFCAGENCHTYSAITIASDSIELGENYGDRADSELIAVGDRLIGRLVDAGVPFTWHAVSSYPDSGETSEARTGTDAEFRPPAP